MTKPLRRFKSPAPHSRGIRGCCTHCGNMKFVPFHRKNRPAYSHAAGSCQSALRQSYSFQILASRFCIRLTGVIPIGADCRCRTPLVPRPHGIFLTDLKFVMPVQYTLNLFIKVVQQMNKVLHHLITFCFMVIYNQLITDQLGNERIIFQSFGRFT